MPWPRLVEPSAADQRRPCAAFVHAGTVIVDSQPSAAIGQYRAEETHPALCEPRGILHERAEDLSQYVLGDWEAQIGPDVLFEGDAGRATEATDVVVSRLNLDASETIGRVLLRREGVAVTFEVGAEGALNGLDSKSALTEGGQVVVLPSANVRIAERRGEAFTTLTWRAQPSLTLEAGARFERSTLTQSGDSRLEKALGYIKPRAVAVWTPNARDELRLEVERRVGQPDFEEFVSAASLTSLARPLGR